MKVSSIKDKGRTTENLLVMCQRETHWPHAERRRQTGSKDQGDTTGHPGLVFEAKAAHKTTTPPIPAWLMETEIERQNAGAAYGILVVRPYGMGEAQRMSMWAFLMADAYVALCPDPPLKWIPREIGPWRRFQPKLWLATAPVVSFPLRKTRREAVLMRLSTCLEVLCDAGFGGRYGSAADTRALEVT